MMVCLFMFQTLLIPFLPVTNLDDHEGRYNKDLRHVFH